MISLLSTQKAKAEFEETAKLEILFLTDILKGINGNWGQLFKKWTSDFHQVTKVLEILSFGTSHKSTKERGKKSEEEVLLFLVPTETTLGTTEWG